MISTAQVTTKRILFRIERKTNMFLRSLELYQFFLKHITHQKKCQERKNTLNMSDFFEQ